MFHILCLPLLGFPYQSLFPISICLFLLPYALLSLNPSPLSVCLSEPLQAQWTGALAHSPGVGVSGKGDSKRSMLGLSALPKNLGLEGKIISHPAGLIEGMVAFLC